MERIHKHIFQYFRGTITTGKNDADIYDVSIIRQRERNPSLLVPVGCLLFLSTSFMVYSRSIFYNLMDGCVVNVGDNRLACNNRLS